MLQFNYKHNLQIQYSQLFKNINNYFFKLLFTHRNLVLKMYITEVKTVFSDKLCAISYSNFKLLSVKFQSEKLLDYFFCFEKNSAMLFHENIYIIKIFSMKCSSADVDKETKTDLSYLLNYLNKLKAKANIFIILKREVFS